MQHGSPDRRRSGRITALATATILLLGSSLTPGLAQDGSRPDATVRGTTRQDTTVRDTTAQDTIPKDTIPQDTIPQDPRLRDLLEQALENNPEILASRSRVLAASERPSRARSLPDPMVGLAVRNVGFPRLSLGDEMMSVVGFRATQALPYPGKRDLRAATATAGIDVAAARLSTLRRRIVRELAESWFELDYVARAIETVEETRALLENLEQTAEARYAVGEGIQQDVLKAQVEVSVLMKRLVVLEQQRDSVVTRINRIADRRSGAPLDDPAATTPPDWEAELDSLQRQAVGDAAIVRERARRVDRQEAAVAEARKERMPDFQVSTAWMNRGGLPDIWEVNLGMTLPLYRESKQDRTVAEAEAELDAIRHEHADARTVVSAAVRDQYLKADRAARLMLLYRDAILPQATLSWESASAGYEVGRVDFLTVLDNLVKLLTFRIELDRQRVDYLQALARLEELTGRSLGALPPEILRRVSAPTTAPGAPGAPTSTTVLPKNPDPREATPSKASSGGGGEKR